MNTSDHQYEFLQDLARLITWAGTQPGYKLTGGELWRNPALQKYYVEAGLSWTNNSRHSSRLAVDLNLFIDGEYQTATKAYRPLGLQWEGLSPLNKWAVWLAGGTLTDGNHFERNPA